MLKILIIGGSGFLSGTMARCAVQEGHQVTVVTRGKRPMPAGIDSVAIITADRKDRDAFKAAIASTNNHWDLVIDCIGFDADDARQDVEVFASRTKHLVFISTDFLLAPENRPWKVDETYSVFNDTPYGLGKRAAEEVILDFVKRDAGKSMRVTVLRPCHIYGPGSLLGCIPKHGRDPQLIQHLQSGAPITLIGGGYFLQHPIFAADLWKMAISCEGNARTHGEIYFAPGPEVIQSRDFYRIIGEILGKEVVIEEISIKDYLAEHPEHKSFCAHRVYSTDKAKSHGLAVPSTSLKDGLRRHVESMPVP